MADRNHLKVVESASIAEDDPFAELTRIMGFDPREPVRQAHAPQKLGPLPAPGVPAASYAPPEEDFAIDLERELLGEFEADEPLPDVQQYAEPMVALAPEPAFETATQAEDEIPDLHLDLVDDFEVEPQEVSYSSATDYSPAAEPEAEYVPSYDAREAEEVEELDFSAEFDAAMQDTDFAPLAEAEFDLLPVELESTQIEAPAAEVDFVDLGERHVPELPSYEEAIWVDAPASEPVSVSPADEPAHEDGDFDLDLDPALELSDEDFEVRTETYDDTVGEEVFAQPQAVPVEAAPEPRFNFENELKALLGGGAAGAAAAGFARGSAQPQPAPATSQFRAPPAAAQPQPAAVEPRPQAARPDARDPLDHTQGLEWMLEDEMSGGSVQSDHDDPLDLLAQMVRSDTPAPHRKAQQPQAQAAHDDLPGFDADAFADALDIGIEPERTQVGDRRAAAESVVEEITAEQESRRPDGRRDPLDVINSLAAKYSTQAGKLFYGRATPVVRREPVQAPAAAPSVVPAAAAAYVAPAAGYAASWQQQEAEPQPLFDPEPVAEAAPALDEMELQPEDIDLLVEQDFGDVPDIETIDVSDRAVAMPDDLDIPDVPFEQDRPSDVTYDDLDTEFASLLNDMNANEAAESDTVPAGSADHLMDFDYGSGEHQNGAAYRHPEFEDPLLAQPFDLDEAMRAADEQDCAGEMERPLAAAPHQDNRDDRPRRGLLIAAAVGGVALVGAIGAYALSFGGSGSDVPVLVSADQGPVKVRPENPGGTRVPNQDNQVYDAVTGRAGAGSPQQEKLVTTAEEPVDVTPAMPEQISADSEADFDEEAIAEDGTAQVEADGPMAAADAPAGSAKNEDRISQIVQDAAADADTEIAAVAPRKVRTMVVRPDGTLAPREDPAPVAEPAAVPQARQAVPSAGNDAVAQMAAAQVRPQPQRAPVSDDTPAQPATPRTTGSTVPDVAPIAPQRPSEQPVQVVGEVKPDRVAAVTNGASAGGWAMQIASQPTEAAAQSSYQALARRYGNVLAGKDVSIVKAEIAGKGTFWRVRVNAPSRNEAVSLCESYKSAGGTCFVSR